MPKNGLYRPRPLLCNITRQQGPRIWPVAIRRTSVKKRASSPRSTCLPASRADLDAFLAGLGIRTTTITHPPLHTVEESRALRGSIPGAHTKNLFLKDKKDAIFLVTTLEDAVLDLKR